MGTQDYVGTLPFVSLCSTDRNIAVFAAYSQVRCDDGNERRRRGEPGSGPRTKSTRASAANRRRHDPGDRRRSRGRQDAAMVFDHDRHGRCADASDVVRHHRRVDDEHASRYGARHLCTNRVNTYCAASGQF